VCVPIVVVVVCCQAKVAAWNTRSLEKAAKGIEALEEVHDKDEADLPPHLRSKQQVPLYQDILCFLEERLSKGFVATMMP